MVSLPLFFFFSFVSPPLPPLNARGLSSLCQNVDRRAVFVVASYSLRHHLSTMKQSTPFHPGKPIAIIGSGCRFPGEASSPSKLWALLSRPSDVLSEIPSTRFNPDGFYHPDGEYHGHGNVRHSYVLSEDHREFDATFFNVSAAEASAIDPQQRMLLECVYEALEDGGQVMSRLKGSSTAVYVGLMCEEYSDLQIRDLNTMPKVGANNFSPFLKYRTALNHKVCAPCDISKRSCDVSVPRPSSSTSTSLTAQIAPKSRMLLTQTRR